MSSRTVMILFFVVALLIIAMEIASCGVIIDDEASIATIERPQYA